MKSTSLFFIIVIFFFACTSSPDISNNKINYNEKTAADSVLRQVADLATILSKREVPVLCYHHIRNFRSGGKLKDYEVTPASFAEQMKALYDSGYKTITPDELYEYLVHGAVLPLNPVMITFDDNDKEQYTIGATEMNKYEFKGVYN